jgi:predicted O-methyltransferase YrrM
MEHIYKQPQFGKEPWFSDSQQNLYHHMVQIFSSGSKFVEVGSWKGRSSAFMSVEIANSGKDIEFYCVDIWEEKINLEFNYHDLFFPVYLPDNPIGLETPYEIYDIFKFNMKPLERYHIPIKMTSLEAAKKFKDKSLDFVFIDASHEYEDVKDDILAWIPKVKPGGIISGDDYYVNFGGSFPGVYQAVNEILENFKVFGQCFLYKSY